jgi:hypothetical protein
MTYAKVHIMQKEQDPLNLRSLPLAEPPMDGWPQVRAALEQGNRRRRLVRYAAGTFAAAATVMLAVGLYVQQPGPASLPSPAVESTTTVAVNQPTLDSLISVSQQLENRVRTFRSEVGGMPTASLVYQVELEDLVAQIDDELSMRPDSLELWNQRVNLLLDLSRLYENQLRRDYHRMASL